MEFSVRNGGIRRFQNSDGTLTDAGKKRYSGDSESSEKSERKGMSDETKAKLKKAAIIGASVAAAGLAAYGGYKYSELVKENKTLKRENSDMLSEIEKGNIALDEILRNNKIAEANMSEIQRRVKNLGEDLANSRHDAQMFAKKLDKVTQEKAHLEAKLEKLTDVGRLLKDAGVKTDGLQKELNDPEKARKIATNIGAVKKYVAAAERLKSLNEANSADAHLNFNKNSSYYDKAIPELTKEVKRLYSEIFE